jgi:SNF2 family DNA or RNA helicase
MSDQVVLWPHQLEAVEKLEPLNRGMLAFEMGAGKTRAALELLRRWDCRHTIVLCPLSVCCVWAREVERVGLAWQVCTLNKGSVAQRAAMLLKARERADRTGSPLLVVLNYDALTHTPLGDTPGALRGYNKGILRQLAWDCVVMDESHKLKAPGGQQSRFVSRLCDGARHRLALTGTPMPHSPLDVYGQFRAVDKHLFGTSFQRFRSTYAVMGGFQNHQVVRFRDLDQLHRIMFRVTHRVRSEDVLDLPGFVDEARVVELSPSERKAYDKFEHDLVAAINGGVVTASNALVKLLRLQQLTNGCFSDELDGNTVKRVTKRPAKNRALADILEEVCFQRGSEGERGIVTLEPVVVFGRFHSDLDAIHEEARALDLGSLELSGRRNQLAEWQEEEAPPVLAVQLQAGGLGIDLTRARYCVYFSQNWSLGDYLQSRARLHRPGQERSVVYVHVIAQGTVDELIAAALERREEVVNYVVDVLGGRGERPKSSRREEP